MKTVSLLTTILALFSPAKAQEVHYRPVIPTVSVPRAKAMIRAVEGTPRSVIGPAGERSEFQLTGEIWRKWSFKPFAWASYSSPECVAETDRVVTFHLAYIKGLLVRAGYPHTPYWVALLWKAGETRWREHTLRFDDTSYAQRAENIYTAVNP